MRALRHFTFVVALLFVTAACGAESPARLRLATTTSTENSGLLAAILPPFEQDANAEVLVIAVGSGKALRLGEAGDADVLLVHARGEEDAFLAAGHGVERRDVMWNDFVVLGPASDPARVRGLRDVTRAFRRILQSASPFVSRGDRSGTHVKENEIWGRAGVDPRTNAQFHDAGQGMGECLTIADEKAAYLLTDRGTYLAYARRLDLEVLVEGDETLRNPYGVLLLNPERHKGLPHALARRFADYLVSPACQARIAAFKKDGQPLFHPAHPVAPTGN